MRFDYREYGNTGTLLDKELGDIPGLNARLAFRQSDWQGEVIASHQRGEAAYTGQTNFGAPYNTRTMETVSDASFRLGYWHNEPRPILLYAGLGWHQWDREIQPATLNGLYETYRWRYCWFGIKPVLWERGRNRVAFDIGLVHPLNAEMDIDYRGTYAVSPTVFPQGRTSLRLMLQASVGLSDNLLLTIEPYLENWSLGRSPTVIVGNLAVYEPASQTANFGVNLRVDWQRE